VIRRRQDPDRFPVPGRRRRTELDIGHQRTGGRIDHVHPAAAAPFRAAWSRLPGRARRATSDPHSRRLAELDPEAWLAAGTSAELPILARSARIYLPPAGPADSDRRVVARYAPKDRLRLSGHLWPESQDRLPGAVFLYEERVGAGRVITFAEDPSFRAYWRGSDRLFLNAVVLGPSAP
jgi:hypothetical protein